MAHYRVRGLTPQGALHQYIVTAMNIEEAKVLARQSGLEVLDVSVAGWRVYARVSSPRFDLALFTHEVLALLRAGLSLVEAVQALAEQNQHAGQGSAVLSDLVRSMQEGQAFSSALKAHPHVFPDLFIASVAASEQTGEMIDALERYIRYHEQLGAIRQKIVSASLYPVLLLMVGAAVAVFLLCFLVPRFSQVYEGMNTELPLASRWLMQWGLFTSEHTMLTIGLLVLLPVLLFYGARQPGVSTALVQSLQRSRWLGMQLKLMQLSRFYRSLGLLLRGGISMVKALHMTQPLLPLLLQIRLAQATVHIAQGQRLSDSLSHVDLTTPVALRLLRAGERNGQVAEMLERVADFHDQETTRWIDKFTRLFEPVLMIVIGLAIGGIVILLYLPIFELAGSLQ